MQIRCVVTEIACGQSGSGVISCTVRVRALEVSTQLDGVIAFHPRKVFRPVPSRIRTRGKRITLYTADVSAVSQVIHVNVRHTEISSAEWTGIDTQTSGIDL